MKNPFELMRRLEAVIRDQAAESPLSVLLVVSSERQMAALRQYLTAFTGHAPSTWSIAHLEPEAYFEDALWHGIELGYEGVGDRQPFAWVTVQTPDWVRRLDPTPQFSAVIADEGLVDPKTIVQLTGPKALISEIPLPPWATWRVR